MIEIVHRHIIPAAYELLPPAMASRRATAMLLAIGLQETAFLHRLQIPRRPGGPQYARGFWQFERGGGLYGIVRHPRSAIALAHAWSELRYPPFTLRNYGPIWDALPHNDVLACLCARLLLWTLPAALPGRREATVGWGQYLAAWNPGEPRPDDWPGNYAQAWRMVEPIELRAVDRERPALPSSDANESGS